MTLKFQLDTLEGVDESVQSMYVEKDGKFVLNIEGLPGRDWLNKERFSRSSCG